MARLLTNSHSVHHLWDVAPRIAHLLAQVAVLLWAVQVVLGSSETHAEAVHETTTQRS